MQIIYGTRVSPFTAEFEVVKRKRIVIFQDEFNELQESIKPEDINCFVFAPPAVFEALKARSEFESNNDWEKIHCLKLVQKTLRPTVEALKIIKEVFSDIEELNSDDDEVFARYLETSA